MKADQAIECFNLSPLIDSYRYRQRSSYGGVRECSLLCLTPYMRINADTSIVSYHEYTVIVIHELEDNFERTAIYSNRT